MFDFDGTLADSLGLGLRIVNELSSQYGYAPVTHAEVEELRGQSITHVFKRLHIPIYKLPVYIHQVKKELTQHVDMLTTFDGIPELLHELKRRGIPMAMVTSNSYCNVQPFLQKYDIDVFNWHSCDVGLLQKTANIRKQIALHKLDKHRIIYVGDEVRDIKAAKVAEVTMVSVSWGFQPSDVLLSHHPDYLIYTPQELLSIL